MSGDMDHVGLNTEAAVLQIKCMRDSLESLRGGAASMRPGSRQISLAITRIEEARMWLGMELKRLNEGVSCYEQGGDPSNARVEESQ